MIVKRIFDIPEYSKINYPSKADALAKKIDGTWQTYSFEEYYHTIQLLCYGLMELGLEKGDKAVTVSNNCPEWNMLDMALLQLGIIHVPIYPTLSKNEYDYILSHCQPKLLMVAEKAVANKLLDMALGSSSIEHMLTFDHIEGALQWKTLIELGQNHSEKHKANLFKIKDNIDPDEIATLIYTSGTTGTPKGVMLSHKNVMANLEGVSKRFDFSEKDRTLSFLPICHVFERTINYYFQLQGVSIYYAENLGAIANNLKEIKPTVFIAVPRILERIYDKIIEKGKTLTGIKKRLFDWSIKLGNKYDYHTKNPMFLTSLLAAKVLVFSKWRKAVGGKVRLIVVGGAALQPRLARIFNAAGIPVFEGYGMTETSPVIAANSYKKGTKMIGTVGPILENIEVRLSNKGEILVRGDSVMKGYYKNEEATKQVLSDDGWLCTGDVGEFVDNKFLKITDRKKEIFKLSSGKYISPQSLENKLKESAYIEQAIIIGENEKFASAIISPNFEMLKKWCHENNIHFSSKDEAIKMKEVLAVFQKDVNTLNSTTGQTEQIKRFKLVTDEWTSATGELSQTLKLKRKYLMAQYEDLIQSIYSVQKKEADTSIK